MYGLGRDLNVQWLRGLRKAIPWWGLLLLLLPMMADGLTHMFGVRDAMLPPEMDASFGSFYIGSQVFSFNWWLRIITGLTAALGAVWFAFPRMDRAVSDSEALRLIYQQSAANPQPPVSGYQPVLGSHAVGGHPQQTDV
jgi:uncharacterized membrane protein